jgi:predicted permease
VDFLESEPVLDARSSWFLSVLGRLRPVGRLTEAQAELGRAARAIYEATVPTHWTADEQRGYTERTLGAQPAANGPSAVRGQYRDALLTLLVVVGVVLLIACANVAQLLLARATSRRHEIAVRLALGSGRARLVRQLLTESMLLALLGGAVGILFARWSSGFVVGLLSPTEREVWLDLSIDYRVFGFTIAVAAATGILFGLAPAWRCSRIDAQTVMRGAGRGVVGDTSPRFVRGIVVCQVALSLVLIVAAGLLVGSFRRLATLDPGFRRDDVLVAEANWSSLGLADERSRTFPRELLERVRAIPGVRSASASLIVPISGSGWNDNVEVAGFAPRSRRVALVWFNAVTDGYLETLGTDLQAGRDFTPQDREGASPVVLVNQTMAQRFFGAANPVGKSIRTNTHDSLSAPMEIIGVVEDAKYNTLDEETLPAAYVPLAQSTLWGASIELALRSDGPPSVLIPAVTAALRDIHPAITLEFATLDDQVARSLARPRLLALLSGFFGTLALLLAVVGLYGTMSYSVARRRSEIGIRIALGAARTGILGMVAGEAGKVIAIGVALGALLAIAATRLLAAFLYGVTANDPVTLVLSALALAAVAMVAGLLPAWRAAAVDPMLALREES